MSSQKFKTLPGYALIQLSKKYESGLAADKDKYSTNSSGVLLAYTLDIPKEYSSQLDEYSEEIVQLLNKTVYFTPYEDGDIIKIEDTEYVFVPIKALRGGLL